MPPLPQPRPSEGAKPLAKTENVSKAGSRSTAASGRSLSSVSPEKTAVSSTQVAEAAAAPPQVAVASPQASQADVDSRPAPHAHDISPESFLALRPNQEPTPDMPVCFRRTHIHVSREPYPALVRDLYYLCTALAHASIASDQHKVSAFGLEHTGQEVLATKPIDLTLRMAENRHVDVKTQVYVKELLDKVQSGCNALRAGSQAFDDTVKSVACKILAHTFFRWRGRFEKAFIERWPQFLRRWDRAYTLNDTLPSATMSAIREKVVYLHEISNFPSNYKLSESATGNIIDVLLDLDALIRSDATHSAIVCQALDADFLAERDLTPKIQTLIQVPGVSTRYDYGFTDYDSKTDPILAPKSELQTGPSFTRMLLRLLAVVNHARNLVSVASNWPLLKFTFEFLEPKAVKINYAPNKALQINELKNLSLKVDDKAPRDGEVSYNPHCEMTVVTSMMEQFMKRRRGKSNHAGRPTTYFVIGTSKLPCWGCYNYTQALQTVIDKPAFVTKFGAVKIVIGGTHGKSYLEWAMPTFSDVPIPDKVFLQQCEPALRTELIDALKNIRRYGETRWSDSTATISPVAHHQLAAVEPPKEETPNSKEDATTTQKKAQAKKAK